MTQYRNFSNLRPNVVYIYSRLLCDVQIVNAFVCYTCFLFCDQLAVCAKHHNVPFYVCAPTTSIDLSLTHGKEIPIEERPHKEMTDVAGTRIAAPGKYSYSQDFISFFRFCIFVF